MKTKSLDEILVKIDEEIMYCRSASDSQFLMSDYYKGAMYAMQKLKRKIEDEN